MIKMWRPTSDCANNHVNHFDAPSLIRSSGRPSLRASMLMSPARRLQKRIVAFVMVVTISKNRIIPLPTVKLLLGSGAPYIDFEE